MTSHNQYFIEGLRQAEGGKETEEFFKKDLQWLAKLDNPHFVKLIKNYDSGILKRDNVEQDIKYYVTEQYSREGIQDIMFALEDGVQQNIARCYFLQLCRALTHAHSKGITVRHVGEHSIHFTFGCSIILDSYTYISSQFKDTGFYKDNPIPEAKEQEVEYVTAPADVFMLGNALRAMCFNDKWFGCSNFASSQEYHKLAENRTYSFFAEVTELKIMDYVPESLQQILTLMLQPDPALRPSIAELTKHEWVTEDSTSYAELQDYMDVLYYTTRENSKNAEHIRKDFSAFIDRVDKRQPIVVRQYFDPQSPIFTIMDKCQRFVTNKGEELFNALAAYNDHNGFGNDI